MGASINTKNFDKECFFIAPIGSDESDERKRSDGIFDFIVAPAASELGLKAIRADHIGQPGIITTQVIAHVLESKAAVVDLSGLNPNVFYELAIRHTAQRPTALIAEINCDLPFDIAQMRTIFFNHTDLRSANDCKLQIVEQLRDAIDKGSTDSPIGAAIDIQGLQTGSAIERMVADLVEKTETLARTQIRIEEMIGRVNRRTPLTTNRYFSAWEDLFDSLLKLQDAIISVSKSGQTSVVELLEIYNLLTRPIRFLYEKSCDDLGRILPTSTTLKLLSPDHLASRIEEISSN
jgi:hypothetical protein